ncbi:MAG: winged helix-turn-helix domain-containing protein [Candidatus Dormibacteria bacterium]
MSWSRIGSGREPPSHRSPVAIHAASDPTSTARRLIRLSSRLLSSRCVRLTADPAPRDGGGSPASTPRLAQRLLEGVRALADELEQLRSDNHKLLADRERLLRVLAAGDERLARARSIVKPERTPPARTAPPPPATPTARRPARRVGGAERLRIDRASATVLIYGEEVPLAPREFRLLSYLLDHEGQDLRITTLLREVWADSGDPRTLRVHINAVRRKLEAFTPAPIRILTLHRVGYRLDGVQDDEE